MKKYFFKSHLRSIENLIKTLSKGYYKDFSEYHPDQTLPDDEADHTSEKNNDHTIEKESDQTHPLKKRKI